MIPKPSLRRVPSARTRTVGVLIALVAFSGACAGTSDTDVGTAAGSGDDESQDVDAGVDTTEPTTTTTTTTTIPPRPPADTLTMEKLTRITGELSPKSVVASGTGVVTAQNMMYRHTVTAYDAHGNLIATVPDTVTLSDFGIDKEGEFKGAPVEASFMPDGSAVYVSNYSMYGEGFREGSDKCSPSDGTPPSFLYRIDTETWEIDQVIPTGAVPKYVAVTPDGSKVLATNWCTFDMTIADTETGEVLNTVPIGRYPRGIAISPDGVTAYVAVMGGTEVVAIDIESGAQTGTIAVGAGPRHLVMGPDGRYLYATLNKEGKVAKIDLSTGGVVTKVATGQQPRSMDISDDGRALYVVNYASDDVSKLATEDMSILQTVPAGHHPIGITYDRSTGRVWVANYSGSIDVWDEVETPA
jgi:YVTN family beta-propeller protein